MSIFAHRPPKPRPPLRVEEAEGLARMEQVRELITMAEEGWYASAMQVSAIYDEATALGVLGVMEYLEARFRS